MRTHDTRYGWLRSCDLCIGCTAPTGTRLRNGACPYFMSAYSDYMEQQKQRKRKNPYKFTSANDYCQSGEVKKL